MATSKYYVGDVGTLVTVDTTVDITDASVRSILVKRPDGTTTTWVGTLSGTTSIAYTVQAGDFNTRGMYLVQAFIVTPDGQWRGDVASFEVSPAWE